MTTTVHCDARTRHVSQRYVEYAISEIRTVLRDVYVGKRAFTDINGTLDALELTALQGSPAECGWTGEVPDPNSWTCPMCYTWRTTPEGRMNR